MLWGPPFSNVIVLQELKCHRDLASGETMDDQWPSGQKKKKHLTYKGKCLGTAYSHSKHGRHEAITAEAKS